MSWQRTSWQCRVPRTADWQLQAWQLGPACSVWCTSECTALPCVLQGNRITEGISCADVADVCLKALHDPAAHNKTFEVCYEYTPQAGLDMYELVAHLPDKSNNYLGPALQTLQKNT